MKPSDFEDSLRKTYEEAINTDHLPHGAIKSESLTYTPDTEWEERFNEIYPSVTVGYDGSEMDARKRAKVWQFIEDEITTLNARHHTTLTSRDTYWKERVRKEVEGIRKPETTFLKEGDETWDYSHIIAHNLALDTLLDNLK